LAEFDDSELDAQPASRYESSLKQEPYESPKTPFFTFISDNPPADCRIRIAI